MEGQKFYSLLISDQNKSCSECQQDVRNIFFAMSICQHVCMSVCQYVRMQLFSLGIKMKVVQNVIGRQTVIMPLCQYVSMSVCQYVNMSICQYVNMSECNFSAWVSK